ncbi:YafY family transcriptional regulator [bacterium]|nr:YafY family transcriptional regulator [bacterium]
MRRADRLFQIIQILRRRRTITASVLSEKLEVSKRTIYRDVSDLIQSGVPIEGEAGVGYLLSSYYDLPPLMFTEDEIESLVLGARIVKSSADKGLAKAAESILSKVETILPDHLKQRIENSPLFSVNFDFSDEQSRTLEQLRIAISKPIKIRFSYIREDKLLSERTVRPLGLSFIPPVWLLTAWCELRNEFRNFRPDRINNLEFLRETFPEEPGKTMADYLASVR